MNGLERAVSLCRLAGLAKACGVSPQAVHKWLRSGIPAERVLDVERATVPQEGGAPRVTRHELRPDLYPLDQEQAA